MIFRIKMTRLYQLELALTYRRGQEEECHNLQPNYTKEDIKDVLQQLQNKIYDLSKIVNETQNVKTVS